MISRIQRLEKWLNGVTRRFAYSTELDAIINDETDSPETSIDSTYSASKIENDFMKKATSGATRPTGYGISDIGRMHVTDLNEVIFWTGSKWSDQ